MEYRFFIKTYCITDMFMCIFVCSLLAFRDYSKIIIFLSVFMLCWLILNKLRRGILKRNILYFGIYKLLFIVLCMGSSLWSVNPNITYLCLSMLYRMLICFCVLFYVNSEDNFIKLIKFCLLGSCLLCLRLLIVVPVDAWGNNRVGTYLSYDPDNSYGNTGITYVLGVFSAILIGDKSSLFVSTKTRYLLIIVFSLFSLLSGSKKQIFIIFVALVILLFFNSKNIFNFIKKTVLYCVVVFLIFFIVMNVDILYHSIGYRLESFFSFFGNYNTANLEDLSTVSRLSFLKDAFSIFLEHPFIGVGIDSFKYFNSFQFSWAECNFLEILADLGIVGFIIYYLPHIRILNNLIKRYKRKSNFLIISLILFAVLLFIDATMVSYNEAHLQFYLAILYSYCFLINTRRDVKCKKV
ncbi:O-antigen ligase family protein [Amedibacillus dolichus]|uniref:O-antigen ligase family protein n=1 Tax=Amedibacillus dolichus TaxID=31971 RepID=UPI001EDA2334|nr:O-antigen ligase family protein [Amedibacillus dolichus]MCG4879040.1 O-antigen ligase family protein [Amedibacillus dolichus]